MPDHQDHQPPSVATEVSNRMVQLLSEYTGRGPTQARALIDVNMIVVVFQDVLTKGERRLVDAGETQPVALLRRTFHRLMEDDAIRVIEQVTGRKVGSVLSDIDARANLGANVFMLDPQHENGAAVVAESSIPFGLEGPAGP